MAPPLHRPAESTLLLNDRLAPKKTSVFGPALLVFGIVLALGFAGYGYLESQRTERVVVALRAIPYGQQLAADDLGTIELPLHRPMQMAGIPDPNAIIGQYAARAIGVNDLLKPDMLMVEPPQQPVFPNGRELPANMTTIQFPVAAIGPVRDHDTINVGFNDAAGTQDLCVETGGAPVPSRSQIAARPALEAGPPANSKVAVRAISGALASGTPYACRLLQGVEVLYVDGETAYLSVSPYQALALQAVQAQGLALWGELYGRVSDPLPALDRLSPEQIDHEHLTALVADPESPPATPDRAPNESPREDQ